MRLSGKRFFALFAGEWFYIAVRTIVVLAFTASVFESTTAAINVTNVRSVNIIILNRSARTISLHKY